MARKYSLHNITALSNRKVFFDANVLIYLFWPSGSFAWENSYSTAFSKLLRQKNELITNFIVISEIVNRAHRLEYEKFLVSKNIPKTVLNYKRYRNSQEGEAASLDIFLIIETNILALFSIADKAFTKEDIQSFLRLDSLDFADKAILSICKEHGFVLLTNDADYKSSNIDILTSNPAILRN